MSTIVDFRKDFPFLQKKDPVIYLDTAASAQKPQCVIDTIQSFYSENYATVHRGVYRGSLAATTLYEEARQKIQAFIHAEHAEEIIFTRGTTHSLNLLARSFAKSFLRPKDAILLTEIEHHSNLIPWQMIAEEYGCTLRFIPVNDHGELIFEEFLDLLDEKVKIVSLAHISNVIGTLHPVEKIIEKAHEAGAYVCLDGAQAAAHLPLDVQSLDVDFYAFSGHKLYGPTGVGILYGKKELLNVMLPVEGGGDMVEYARLESAVYNKLPLKFEAGTPMIAQAIGLGTAVDYLSSIGMDVIQSWESTLLGYATKKISQIPGLRIIGTAKEKGGIISFVVDGVHPLDLATFLDCKSVALRSGHHCSQPAMERFGLSATCRISFGLYNTFEEIDYFVHALKEVLELLG